MVEHGVTGEWAIDDIHGRPVAGDAVVSLHFGADARLAGSTGVNRLAAPFELDGDHITVGPLVTTRLAGTEAAMDQERRFLAALQTSTRWHIAGEVMWLGGEHGDISMHHVVVPLVVRGHVSYRERIAFPGNAVVTVELHDMSQLDAAPTVIASHVISDAVGAPVEFELSIERALVAPPRHVGITARIEVDGEPWWISDTNHQVIDDDAASHDLVLARVEHDD